MDLYRIFVGEEGWTFLAEIAFRTTVLYVFTFLMVRLSLRRAITQISIAELLLVVALGSAVGDPMFYPDVPLLHGMVVVTVVVMLGKALGMVMSRFEQVEVVLEGASERVVEDGIINYEALTERDLAPEELFEMLRVREVDHLGEVRAAYLEQNGELSVFRHAPEDKHPGLAIEPPDPIARRRRYDADATAPTRGYYSCKTCGFTRVFEAGDAFGQHVKSHAHWTESGGQVAWGDRALA